MHLEFKNNLFYVKCHYHYKDILRAAGFNWNAKEKVWITPFADIAESIFKDKKYKDIILNKKQKENQIYNASFEVCPQRNEESYETPDLQNSFLPYQKAGIDFLIENKNVLLADEMGLGKTIQILGMLNSLYSFNLSIKNPQNPHPKILVVCPASLKTNWLNEFNKWNTSFLTAEIITPLTFMSKKNIFITNYEMLEKYSFLLEEIIWDILILDECHYIKNSKAKRTKNIFKLKANKKIALSGTPLVNKPIELFNILNFLHPEAWNNKMYFALNYCNAYKNYWGWDMTGASNLEDLKRKLRSTIMIRREKKDVLKDLPDKIHQLIELDLDKNTLNLIEKEKKWLKNFFNKNSISNKILTIEEQIELLPPDKKRIFFTEISTLRRETGEAKISMIIDFLNNVLLNDKKVICFCHHKEVLDSIQKAFNDKVVSISGSTSLIQRDKAVKEFQTNPNIKLFVGNIRAAGTGLTLTASSHIIFAELSWVSGEMIQAEDRAHRIGQKNSVLIQYLVLKDSLDAKMAKILLKKKKILNTILS